MSYLDVPRLHFTGTFTGNPSTINNIASNYNPDRVNALELLWNPYGSHAWTITAQVTSFVDSAGQLHTDGDPLIGASFESYVPNKSTFAKMVDLDTEQQMVTRLFGLNLQLTLAGGGDTPAFQGLWDNGGTLVNVWGRVPTLQNASGAGGAFQSVLQNVHWNDFSGSPLLEQLQNQAQAGLSVRLSVYGYQLDNTSPSFRIGSIVGTIGPYLAGEPLHLPPRLLLPGPASPLAWAPAKVSGGTVTIDLGNSIPDQNRGGPPADIGKLEAAVLSGSRPTLTSLGTIDYQGATFQQTAGVVQFPITPDQAGKPLAILVNGVVQLAENADGRYIDVDGSSVYMNPGDTTSVNIWATSFGSAAAEIPVALKLVPGGSDNNQPSTALDFPESVTTGADGSVTVKLTASNPSPLPKGRQDIGGQLYFIGGDWAAGNVYRAPLNVKLFNSIKPPVTEPTWTDVQPILYKYYYLYAYMAAIVDLSNYDSVKSSAKAIQGVLTLGFDDPSYMPVTREMSNDERKLILTWIDNGCLPGNDAKIPRAEAFTIKSGFRRPSS